MMTILLKLFRRVLKRLTFFSKVKRKRSNLRQEKKETLFRLDLLKQTLDLHPDASMIHIGADEVQLINKNPKCSKIEMNSAEQYVQ